MAIKDKEEADTMSLTLSTENHLACRITIHCNMKEFPYLTPDCVIDHIQMEVEEFIRSKLIPIKEKLH